MYHTVDRNLLRGKEAPTVRGMSKYILVGKTIMERYWTIVNMYGQVGQMNRQISERYLA